MLPPSAARARAAGWALRRALSHGIPLVECAPCARIERIGPSGPGQLHDNGSRHKSIKRRPRSAKAPPLAHGRDFAWRSRARDPRRASLSCSVSQPNTAGMNQGFPLNSGTGAGRAEIQRRVARSIAEDLLCRLLAGPARPDDARAAVARRVAHAVPGEDARDHVAVHRDMTEPAMRDAGAVEHGEDVDERAAAGSRSASPDRRRWCRRARRTGCAFRPARAGSSSGACASRCTSSAAASARP